MRRKEQLERYGLTYLRLHTSIDYLCIATDMGVWLELGEPTITVYQANQETANGCAVVICPGGGYNILAYDLEGTEIADWLNSLGVTAVVQWATEEPGCWGLGACMRTKGPFRPAVTGTRSCM